VTGADAGGGPDVRAFDATTGKVLFNFSDVEGYIVLHATKSTVITATSEQRLAAAVKRFIESSRQHNGKHQVPFGLAASFELAR